MLYFLQGTEQFLIDKEIKTITSQLGSEEIIYYSALETSLQTIVLEMCSDDLFGRAKLIILKDLTEVDSKSYLEFLDEQTTTTMAAVENGLIILFQREDALSKTQENLFKTLFRQTKRISVQKRNDQQVITLLTDQLKNNNHNLTRSDMLFIAQKYKNDVSMILQELEQIIMSKTQSDTSPITIADFKDDTTDFIEEQVFDLITMIDQKNVDAAFTLLHNTMLHQQNIFGIVALLFKNYKEMFQIHALKRVGYSFMQISKRLTIHEYRVKKLWQSSQNISMDSLQVIVELLIDTDRNLKRGAKVDLEIKALFLKIFKYI